MNLGQQNTMVQPLKSLNIFQIWGRSLLPIEGLDPQEKAMVNYIRIGTGTVVALGLYLILRK